MNLHLTKQRAAALVSLLALTTAGGVALAAEDPSGWYTGGNATVPDPDKTAVALTLYDAAGAPVTSGSTTTPLAAFVGAGDTIRTGDQFASLWIHLTQPGTAPGAWPGLQVTGTDRYAGAGAITAPAALANKPYVRTNVSGDYTLASVASALPSTSTAAGFAGVYELRLRTSSSTAAVSDKYATTYLKVTGTTWTVTTAPALGATEGPATTPPATTAPPTTTPTTTPPTTTAPVPTAAPGKVSAALSYRTVKAPTTKKKGTGTVSVATAAGRAAATGSVRVVLTKGSVSKTVVVSLKGGAGAVKLPKLPAGAWKVTLSYAGDATYLPASGKGAKLKVKAAR